MNDGPTAEKLAALLPATDGGNTMSVTADPGTVVPGVTSQSTPTVQPAVCVPTGWPMSASGSVNSAVVPPAAVTLNLIWLGVVFTYVEIPYAATDDHVGPAGGVALEAYWRASIGLPVALMTRS